MTTLEKKSIPEPHCGIVEIGAKASGLRSISVIAISQQLTNGFLVFRVATIGSYQRDLSFDKSTFEVPLGAVIRIARPLSAQLILRAVQVYKTQPMRPAGAERPRM